VLVGPAPARTILDCYRDLLALCTRHKIDRALVVSSDADGTTHAALAQAVEAMSNRDLAAGQGRQARAGLRELVSRARLEPA
jgi:CTP:molybdopterin cytidylyltransferase MocA